MFTIYFVHDTLSELLKQAYDSINGMDLAYATWIKESEIFKISNFSKNSTFVLGTFDCSSFNYLRSMKIPIFGPQCLLDYLRSDEVLPKVTIPLFSTALKNVEICFTSIDDERKKILSEKINMMHGTVSKDLKVSVRVLISPSVQTLKCRVALENRIPVVKEEWIDELWNLSKSCDQVNGLDDSLIEKYRIPILYNLKICLSGFSEVERDESKQMITENGGTYCPDLTMNNCTHLISKDAFGQKFNYANKWEIKTVSLEWLTESVRKGYACDENQYQLSGKINVHGSTPKKESRNSFDPKCNEMSIISIGHQINETILRDCDDLECVPDLRIWNDCVIEFFNCEEQFVTKWENLIKDNGGKIRNSSFTMTSTHIIVGDGTNLFKKMEGVIYLNSDWLQACLNEKRLVDVNKFIFEIQKKQIALTDNWGSLGVCDWDDTMKIVESNDKDKITISEKVDVSIEVISNVCDWDDTTKIVDSNEKDKTTLTEKFDMSAEEISNGIFHKLKFYLDNLPNEKSIRILNSITENAGIAVSNPTESTHYILPDIFSQPIKSISNSIRFITLFYIEECINQNQLLSLDSDFMFIPLPIDINIRKTILSGTVISFSGYPGEERRLLKTICTEFGAIVQDQMSRKAIPSKQLLATTHLIISKPDKKKFPSSKNWEIPAVTKHWIGGCINEKKRIDTSKYSLRSDDCNFSVFTTTSDKSNFNDTCISIIDPPMINNDNKPINQLPILEESESISNDELKPQKIDNEGQFKTPAVNKHLQIRNTIQGVNNLSFDDMESPILRVISNLEKPNIIIDEDMFKTPEYWKRYPKKVSSISTPQMAEALKSRLALLDIETKKRPNNFSDTSLSETDPSDLSKPLKSVSIYICKSLQAEQIKLREIIENLGGNCCWVYDSKTVTHVVCCSITKENSSLSIRNRNEIIKSVRDGKILVTSDWLLSCNNETRLVDEEKYLVNISDLLDMKDSETNGKKRKVNEDLPDVTNQNDQPTAKKRLSQDSCGVKNQIEWNYEQKSTCKQISEIIELTEKKTERIFLLCTIDKALYQDYSEQIKNLGASIELNSDFCMNITHLICGEPSRTEKYLSAIAAGKWVLHKSYLDESIATGKWLDEKEFQWGGPRTKEFLKMNPKKTYSKEELALIDASKRLHEIGGGAFKEWRVCLIEKKEKYEKMCKIIEAGGGTVLRLTEPISQLHATHFLINKTQCTGLPNLSSYPCYRMELIPFFLTARNESEIRKVIKKFTIPCSEMKNLG